MFVLHRDTPFGMWFHRKGFVEESKKKKKP